MIFIAFILVAAIPHTDNPWAVSAFSVLAMTCTVTWIQGGLIRIQENQKAIYEKLSGRG